MKITSALSYVLFLQRILSNQAFFSECSRTEFDLLSGNGKHHRTELTPEVLFDPLLSNAFLNPASMEAFQIPPNAAPPTNTFCGTLSFLNPHTQGNHKKRLNLETLSPEAHHLPPFSQGFVQHGSHLIPLNRGRQDVASDFWELIVSPGRVWDEDSDIESDFRDHSAPREWSRASIPIALIFKKSNPHVHNGVITFTFSNDQISNVAYEVAQETSLTFRYDYWGLLEASYEKYDFPTIVNTTEVQANYEIELMRRIPTKDYKRLQDDYGMDISQFGRERRNLFFAFQVDGVAYTGGFGTQYGKFPYPESLVMTSHSFAKTFFTALTAFAMEEEFGNVLSAQIADLIDSADRSWDGVTIQNALDMSTGHYKSPAHMVDDSFLSCSFFQADGHEEILQECLTCYPKKKNPGEIVVYHSSDTYIAVTAMRKYLERFSDGGDLIEYFNTRIGQPLGLSELFQNAIVTTNDVHNQPLGFNGLFFILDDILKLSKFVHPGNENRGKINGDQILDRAYLDKALQIEERGLPLDADGYDWYYKLAFWSLNFDKSQDWDCSNMKQIPIAKGHGGQILAMFPNNTTYVSFASSLLNDRNHNVLGIAEETIKIQCD